MARRSKVEAMDPKRRDDLRNALEAGAFRVGAGSRLLRQMNALSQADLAAMLGVNLKVIKSLESGSGNPGLAAIENLAEAFGLAVVFASKAAVAKVLDSAARAEEKARSRAADAQEVDAGQISEHKLNARNALRIGRAALKLPTP